MATEAHIFHVVQYSVRVACWVTLWNVSPTHRHYLCCYTCAVSLRQQENLVKLYWSWKTSIQRCVQRVKNYFQLFGRKGFKFSEELQLLSLRYVTLRKEEQALLIQHNWIGLNNDQFRDLIVSRQLTWAHNERVLNFDADSSWQVTIQRIEKDLER